MRNARHSLFGAVSGLTLGALAACGHGLHESKAEAPPAGTSPDRIGYVEANGLEMYYESHGTEAGREPPLVLIHGGGSTIHTTFGQVLPALARKRQVIAVETQGHGHTADMDRPLTFEQDADDVAALVRELGIDRADVFGFSNGGNVALQLGMRHPGIVRKLIVASAFVASDGLYPEVRASFRHGSVGDMPAALRRAYESAAPDPSGLPVLVSKLMKRLVEFRDTRPEDLRRITAPTLIMQGDADVVRPEHAVEMVRLLPSAQLAIFPGADHGGYLGEVTSRADCEGCPQMAVQMIERFLDEPMPGPASEGPGVPD